MKIFKDRQSAGKLLADHLKHYKGKDNFLVLGIPRGGVAVGKEIADQLKLPFDIVITRKIGAPNQTELALGAVDGDGVVVWEESLLQELSLKHQQLSGEVKKQVEEIKRREKTYRLGKSPLDVSGKIAILVDDGMATGTTMLSAVRFLKAHGAQKVILAAPLSSKEAFAKVAREVDETVILYIPDSFQAVGQFYDQFEPVSDEEVVEILRQAQDNNKD